MCILITMAAAISSLPFVSLNAPQDTKSAAIPPPLRGGTPPKTLITGRSHICALNAFTPLNSAFLQSKQRENFASEIFQALKPKVHCVKCTRACSLHSLTPLDKKYSSPIYLGAVNARGASRDFGQQRHEYHTPRNYLN